MLPFRLGPTHSQPRREVQAAIQRLAPAQTPLPSMRPGTPISMQSQLKKMQPQTISSICVPFSGSMRHPAPPTMPTISTHVSQPVAEAPTNPSETAPSEGSTVPQEVARQPQPETQVPIQPDPIVLTPASMSPIKPPSHNPQPTLSA